LLPALLALILACSGGGGGLENADLSDSQVLEVTPGVDAEVAPDAVLEALPDSATDLEAVPDADTLADAVPDSVTVPDAAADAAPELEAHPEWILPPCYMACDRITACGVEACVGFDWSNSGVLFEACFAVCDEPWAQGLLALPGCPEVLNGPATSLAAYVAGCDSNPCDQACAGFAACVVDQCEAIDDSWQAGIAQDCHDWCTPESTAWLLETPCKDLLAALAQDDPQFDTTCHGQHAVCPGPDLCDPWGAKLAGCIQAHCQGNADQYQPGLEWLLSAVCQTDPQCATAEEVAAALAPELTCDSPGLSTLGHDVPFTPLCEGTLGVTPDQVRAACQLLTTCPGAEWMNGVDGCMAYLAIIDGAAARVLCLDVAGDCTGAYACLEGL
jgi:hypothetical protein